MAFNLVLAVCSLVVTYTSCWAGSALSVRRGSECEYRFCAGVLRLNLSSTVSLCFDRSPITAVRDGAAIEVPAGESLVEGDGSAQTRAANVPADAVVLLRLARAGMNPLRRGENDRFRNVRAMVLASSVLGGTGRTARRWA